MERLSCDLHAVETFSNWRLQGLLLLNAQLGLLYHCSIRLLFRIDAWTDWTLYFEQFLILHCIKLCYKRVNTIIVQYIGTCLVWTLCIKWTQESTQGLCLIQVSLYHQTKCLVVAKGYLIFQACFKGNLSLGSSCCCMFSLPLTDHSHNIIFLSLCSPLTIMQGKL